VSGIHRSPSSSCSHVQGSRFSVPWSILGTVLWAKPLILVLLLFALAGSALGAVRYVWQASPNPAPPYDTWANAAHDIQTAMDAAVTGDEIVVTNGIYATGGKPVHSTLTNRVVVDKALILRSVNGPQFTHLRGAKPSGGGPVRCVYLTSGAGGGSCGGHA
jgi:hypothetical protein